MYVTGTRRFFVFNKYRPAETINPNLLSYLSLTKNYILKYM